ncbi:hypothetical protein LCGC14_1246040 [marine sediment metagenome]|uniref:Uncharacterized protein n=1 Tax=marine sediment metagenome TaxID=412755 RepID=A0A0F9L894_9ZZZZ|nr:MAG: hypothetical protein Lokiarch_51430 [Candidatus Lokiarchaeum sp. GC14_75]
MQERGDFDAELKSHMTLIISNDKELLLHDYSNFLHSQYRPLH